MLHFSRWKIVFIITICLVSVYLSLPNIYKLGNGKEAPTWLPSKTINLGLDLQGGSHILLEVDFPAYFKEQMEKLRDDIRVALRPADTSKKRFGYTDLQITGQEVTFTLRDLAQAEEVRKTLREDRNDLDISRSDEGKFTIRFQESRLREMEKNVLDQSIEIVRRRVDETGTREPMIQRQGKERILVQVPGLQNPDRIKQLLGKTAKLTFHLLDETNPYGTMTGSVVPSDARLLPGEGDEKGHYLVKKQVMLSGDSLVDARATIQQGQPVVSFRFDNSGAKIFGDVTKQHVNRPFAIVLDNKVISAPVIREPILGGAGVISGHFTTQSANDLALLLRAGALPAPLNVVEERSVGPSLGVDSIAAGEKAVVAGLAFVALFMFLCYGRFGMYANLALIMNIIMLTAALSLFQATLTLPGIAGIVLTMGMSVDANVLVYERIREEIKNGRTPFSAIEAGFTQAFRTIVDSNLTGLIMAALLYYFGSGSVKGFAVTLFIGITASMFTATLLTRLMIVTWLRRTKPKTLVI